MAASPLPSAELLHKLLEYDAVEGVLRWRSRCPSMFKPGNTSAESNCCAWNARYAGNPAGMLNCNGYIVVMVDYRNYLAHRLIWKMAHGSDPDEIDHVDGDRTNNLLSNFRSVSRQQNNQNMKRRKDNSSGVVGVYWIARKRRWSAEIRANGRRSHLGYYAEFDEAVAARKSAEANAGFHVNHGRS
jgi:hypothetical protein